MNEIKKNREKDVNIIDVDNYESTPIQNNQKSINKTHNSNWVDRLKIPYERGIMEVKQIKEETLNMYEKICNLIDEELKKDNSSFNSIIVKLDDFLGYYNDILYTVYCISQGHVIKHYSRDEETRYSVFSYKILENHLGKNIKNKVFEVANDMESKLSVIGNETINYFGFNERGMRIVWWDKDGYLRENFKYSELQIKLLFVTPPRSTIIWEISKVRYLILNLYFDLVDNIINYYENKVVKRKNIKDILKFTNKDEKYLNNEDSRKLLFSLIKISENQVREKMPYIQLINISGEKEFLHKKLSKELLLDIKRTLDEFNGNYNNTKLIKAMIEDKPEDSRLKYELIKCCEYDDKINLINTYRELNDFNRLGEKILLEEKDDGLKLLVLYIFALDKNRLDKSKEQNLSKIIRIENINDFYDLVKKDYSISNELIKELLELKNIIRRKITINESKLQKSRKDLRSTIDIVQDFVGEDEEFKEEIDSEDSSRLENSGLNDITNNDITDKEDNKIKDLLDDKQLEFIKLILSKSNKLSIKAGNEHVERIGSLLNAYINHINENLYDEIEDQIIVIENDNICIDEYYLDMVKELIN